MIGRARIGKHQANIKSTARSNRIQHSGSVIAHTSILVLGFQDRFGGVGCTIFGEGRVAHDSTGMRLP
jgi:hypothetical protein